ncbi:MAG: hypothetical protein QOH08_186, partial [Chloroflexota bacterium]|nr:hypothetical protein [Chloroflexota bacterium]
MKAPPAWSSVDEVARALERERYVADRGLAVTLFLALQLGRHKKVEHLRARHVRIIPVRTLPAEIDGEQP